ncbi:MAG TPA: SCO family protein, partial [Pseudomonadales bacterium]|nr:SCO family protein [Pseudomonadales bacterium]
MNRAAVFLAAVMTLIGTFYAARYFDELVTHENTLPVIETLGGDFALPATSGGTVSLQQFRGRVVLLNFGFTSCPDVCPTVLARMRRLLLGLGDAISDVTAARKTAAR